MNKRPSKANLKDDFPDKSVDCVYLAYSEIRVTDYFENAHSQTKVELNLQQDADLKTITMGN